MKAVALPAASAPAEHTRTAEARAIESVPICVGSTVKSAGKLGDAVLYRSARLPDGRVAVGYYVFFSEERPWGNNWLTWSFFPALAVDLVYTRALLVAPGVQRAAYGKGDVEGFRVVYREEDDGRLVAEEAFSDDSMHRPARLGREDLFSVDPDRITVYTDTWSHHLGARGRRAGDLAWRRCFGSQAIRPLTADVAREFRLDRRAKSALVGPLENTSPADKRPRRRPPVEVATATDQGAADEARRVLP